MLFCSCLQHRIGTDHRRGGKKRLLDRCSRRFDPGGTQERARHSMPGLTARYTHSFKGDEVAAVNALPDLSQPPAGSARATGTDGKPTGDTPQQHPRLKPHQRERDRARPGAMTMTSVDTQLALPTINVSRDVPRRLGSEECRNITDELGAGIVVAVVVGGDVGSSKGNPVLRRAGDHVGIHSAR